MDDVDHAGVGPSGSHLVTHQISIEIQYSLSFHFFLVFFLNVYALRPRSRKRKSSEKSTKPDIFESHICIKQQFIPRVQAKMLELFVLRERTLSCLCLNCGVFYITSMLGHTKFMQ